MEELMGKQLRGSLLFVQFSDSREGGWANNAPIRKLFVSGYPADQPNVPKYIVSLFRDFDLDFRDEWPIRQMFPKKGGTEYCAGNPSGLE